MGEMAGAGEATPTGLKRLAGERPSLVQGGAEKRDRLLAADMDRLPPRMARRDFGAQARAMEIGPIGQVVPVAPELDRRRGIKHGVHGVRWPGDRWIPR